jgi:hypothetical protein
MRLRSYLNASPRDTDERFLASNLSGQADGAIPDHLLHCPIGRAVVSMPVLFAEILRRIDRLRPRPLLT